MQHLNIQKADLYNFLKFLRNQFNLTILDMNEQNRMEVFANIFIKIRI